MTLNGHAGLSYKSSLLAYICDMLLNCMYGGELPVLKDGV